MKHTIAQIIKNNTAHYIHCRSGKLYYYIIVEDTKYTFPVDVTDIDEVGDAIFQIEDKAIYFMRYINKAIKAEQISWETIL
jgi:hypothetical protein